jgi:hypothetical protein
MIGKIVKFKSKEGEMLTGVVLDKIESYCNQSHYTEYIVRNFVSMGSSEADIPGLKFKCYIVASEDIKFVYEKIT